VANSTMPHVVLMDVQMPEQSGIEATREILRENPNVKVVILTTFDVQEYVYDGIRAGAVGYLLKDADTNDLLDGIRAAYRGEAFYRTEAASAALAKLVHIDVRKSQVAEPLEATRGEDLNMGRNLSEPLTERELEVLQQMAYGLRNEQIAAVLNISLGTVKTHVHRILQKFGVDDRTQAVVSAIRQHLVR